MKVGVVVSGGGHLDEALPLLEAFKGHRIFLVTYSQQSLLSFTHPNIERVYFVRLWDSMGIGLYLSLFANFFEFIYILMKERPKILFSTGSEIAIISFLLGKILLRAKLIFIETATRISKPSMTAKVVYPISDLFLVQWETLLKKFGNKAQFRGRVF
jgi:UDP-N-acetylglucosamine:LPS N-acetylglucosamine transferase